MRNLRDPNKPDGPRYKIPRGGAFTFVTSPQYLFELSGWLFWSIMTWSPAGFVVFAISSGNLIPRAFQSQQWYLKKFPKEYPYLGRKALIPGLI